MKRWLLWFGIGLVVYVFGTVAYIDGSPLPDAARFFATVAFRGYVYITLIALAIGIARWLFVPRAREQ